MNHHLALLTTLLLWPLAAFAAEPPHILVRESLQFENIGDSGRVPGTIWLFHQHLPEATVTLWPWHLHEREREMLMRAFPKLRIAEGEVDDAGHASTPELAAAWKDADIFITPARHAKTFQAWAKTGRPYGFFGSHFDPISGRTSLPDGGTLEQLREAITKLPADHFDGHYKSRAVYDGASFVFARDTYSLLYLQGQRLRTPIVEFGLDGTFGIAVRDEMTYEIAVAKEHLFDPLPVDVKPNVIWRDAFWLADEAASVYARAVAVISAECHSPIIALSQGTPAFYVRNPADTVKAQMFRDLGLTNWVFESTHTTGQQLWEKLKPIHEDRAAGRAKVQTAMQQAAKIQKRMIEAIAEAVDKHRSNTSR